MEKEYEDLDDEDINLMKDEDSERHVRSRTNICPKCNRLNQNFAERCIQCYAPLC
jgi:hypothetical protein